MYLSRCHEEVDILVAIIMVEVVDMADIIIIIIDHTEAGSFSLAGGRGLDTIAGDRILVLPFVGWFSS